MLFQFYIGWFGRVEIWEHRKLFLLRRKKGSKQAGGIRPGWQKRVHSAEEIFMKQITSFLQESRYWDQIYTSREGKKLQKVVYLSLYFVQCSEAGQRGGGWWWCGELDVFFWPNRPGRSCRGGIQTSSLMRYVRVCNTSKVWLKVDFFYQFGNF